MGQEKVIDLFVPGRLCLFGEHSDWAGAYRSINSDIAPGMAIVTGIDQGIYARVQKDRRLYVRSILPDGSVHELDCAMDLAELTDLADRAEFFSYVAGVAAYIMEYYRVGGLNIDFYKMTLPIKKGLSSSAAICVLVARAFNILYNLQMSLKGEMRAAYFGEQMTPSRCGKLDQACAYGKHPVSMGFDGDRLTVDRLKVGKELFWVYADLCAHKDTIRILKDLNQCYPFYSDDTQKDLHEALGRKNRVIVTKAIQAIAEGQAEHIGALLAEAQTLFDREVAPHSPVELAAPVLHRVLADPVVKSLTYGGKGVGSQGDGTVQFIARSREAAERLTRYLNETLKLQATAFTIDPQRTVRKAVIPVAGFGTRLYPASRTIKKEFFPIIDHDGYVKPALLVLLEELDQAGIEEICLIIGPNEEKFYTDFFTDQLPDDHMNKLSPALLVYEKKIQKIGQKIRFTVQSERRGFGHAVYQSRDFAAGEPVLLLLGDHIYHAHSGHSCTMQAIEAYEKTGQLTILIQDLPLEDVVHYGIVGGQWDDDGESILHVSELSEKPSVDYARDQLGVIMKNGTTRYFSVFGQYVLTPAVYQELEENIRGSLYQNGEIQLTAALDQVREKHGVYAVVPDGVRFDIGLPEEYRHTVATFGLI